MNTFGRPNYYEGFKQSLWLVIARSIDPEVTDVSKVSINDFGRTYRFTCHKGNGFPELGLDVSEALVRQFETRLLNDEPELLALLTDQGATAQDDGKPLPKIDELLETGERDFEMVDTTWNDTLKRFVHRKEMDAQLPGTMSTNMVLSSAAIMPLRPRAGSVWPVQSLGIDMDRIIVDALTLGIGTNVGRGPRDWHPILNDAERSRIIESVKPVSRGEDDDCLPTMLKKAYPEKKKGFWL